MTPESITILHPNSYYFRSDVVRLTNRALDANDTDQKTWISAFITEVQTALNAGDSLNPALTTSDPLGHSSKHLKWLAKDACYRSQSDADIKTDSLTICTAILAALP